MSSIIQIKRHVTKGKKPASLKEGELAVNTTDKQLWAGDAAGTPQPLIPLTGISTDTGNAAKLGTDKKIFVPEMGVWNVKTIGANHTLANKDIIPGVPMMFSAWNAGGTAVKITFPNPATLTNWKPGQPLAFVIMDKRIKLTFGTAGRTMLMPDDKVFEPRKPYAVIVTMLVSAANQQILCYGELKDK